MEALTQDFSQYWLADRGGESPSYPASVGAKAEEPLPPSLKEALDALDDRINAARSVV
jgi:hypothetical protein